MFDLIIRGGAVYDGTGRPARWADVAVSGGKIAAVEPLPQAQAARVIDARGKWVTPGFIDHRHADAAAFRPGFGELELRQGLTTIVNGNCGLSCAPVGPENLPAILSYLEPICGRVPPEAAQETLAGYFAAQPAAPLHTGMLVGAGTVLNLEQCKLALEMGAKFIVSPGFNEEIVVWCIEHGVGVTPGCVTPTEIMQAMACGLKVVKFFPANVYGGLSAMKALSGPFGGIKFIPTGGVNDKNLAEYISAPFIHAVGGSWLCAKADIAAHNFDKITSLCKEARKTALGFEIAHVGVNAGDAEESLAVCRALDAAFGFGVKEGNSSNFAGSGVEVMKSPYLGKNGHIAVKTNSIPRAAAELAKNGFTLDESTAKYKGEKMVAVYLKQEFGGFAVHLLQK